MSWKDQISTCFGENDCKFAIHPLDEQRAKDAIKEAKASGADRDGFEKEIVWHCYKQVTADGFLQEHIKEQVRRFRKMWGK